MTSIEELIRQTEQIKARLQEMDSRLTDYANGEDLQGVMGQLNSTFPDDETAARITTILTNVSAVLGNAESALWGAASAAERSIANMRK